MATINNSELTKEIIDGAKLSISSEAVPSQLAEKVVPVMEVNPRLLQIIDVVKYGVCTNQTGVNIYVTPTQRDFFLVGYTLSVVKDANATSTAFGLTGVVNSETVNICDFPAITLTAGSMSTNHTFAHPIKLDKGSQINLTSSTAVAQFVLRANFYGYTIENSNV